MHDIMWRLRLKRYVKEISILTSYISHVEDTEMKENSINMFYYLLDVLRKGLFYVTCNPTNYCKKLMICYGCGIKM